LIVDLSFTNRLSEKFGIASTNGTTIVIVICSSEEMIRLFEVVDIFGLLVSSVELSLLRPMLHSPLSELVFAAARI